MLAFKIVILLRTYPHRLELVDSSNIYNLSLTRKNLDEVSRGFLTKWSTDDNNSYFNDLKNHLAIQHICASRNIKFLSMEPTQLYHVDIARDLSQCGINSNKMFADTVLSKL